jgi:hypothetical protein
VTTGPDPAPPARDDGAGATGGGAAPRGTGAARRSGKGQDARGQAGRGQGSGQGSGKDQGAGKGRAGGKARGQGDAQGGKRRGEGQAAKGRRQGAKGQSQAGRSSGRGRHEPSRRDHADETAAQLAGPLQKVLRRLPETQRRVLELRMGLADGHPHDLADTARELGLSLGETREIEKRAFEHIREAIPLQQLQRFLAP